MNTERDPLLLYRELPDDHALPHRSGGHDHAQDAQEGHQLLQRGMFSCGISCVVGDCFEIVLRKR